MRGVITARTQHELRATKANDLLLDPRRRDNDYFTGIHEMGHVLDLMGVGDQFGHQTRARQRLEDTLRGLHNNSGSPSSFGQWLRHQLPGGAFQGNPDLENIEGMNVAEGLAHAFTEGELNPQANDVAKAMHKLLIEESRPETSQLLRQRMPNQMYRDSWESNYGKYPGYQPDASPPQRIKPRMDQDTAWDLPYGFSTAIDDVQEKYPQAVIGDVDVDELNRGGTAFVIPETSTGFEPGKPSVTKSRPDLQMERKWVDADLPSWDESFDQNIDEGFFPRWQSTTAGEPWPEDQIEDMMTEFDQPKTAASSRYDPANRTDPAALNWKTLLWMNGVMRGARTPEERAYADALSTEVVTRNQPRAASHVFADPDGAGVWKITVDLRTGAHKTQFLARPAPGTLLMLGTGRAHK